MTKLENMVKNGDRCNNQICFRVSPTLLRKVEEAVDSGEFSSSTELMVFALHYFLNRQELRKGLLYDIVDEVDTRIQGSLRDALYSLKNKEFLYEIIGEVARDVIISEMEKDK